jgi:hypothetical protein
MRAAASRQTLNKYIYGEAELFLKDVPRVSHKAAPSYAKKIPLPINTECPVAQIRLRQILIKMVKHTAHIKPNNCKRYKDKIKVIKELIHTQTP